MLLKERVNSCKVRAAGSTRRGRIATVLCRDVSNALVADRSSQVKSARKMPVAGRTQGTNWRPGSR